MDCNGTMSVQPVQYGIKDVVNSLIGALGHTGSNHHIGGNQGQSGPNHGQSGLNHGQTPANRGQSGALIRQQAVFDGLSNNSSLSILKDVQRAYEERLEVIERVAGPKKMQMTVEVLRLWVSDLVGQNALLARAVEDLEAEATKRLVLERARHQEPSNQKRQGTGIKELKTMNETLQKENMAKEREIRRLNKDMQQYEQTIVSMRGEISGSCKQETTIRKDAEVMVGLCLKSELDGPTEMNGFSSLLREEAARYQERIRKMEGSLKSSGESVRALRKVNVALSEELHALRRVCAALDEQARAAGLRAQFKDDIIREMRRQLKQAKAKLKECNGDPKCVTDASGDTKLCTAASSRSEQHETCQRQPQRAGSAQFGTSCYRRDATPLHPDSDDCHTPRFDGSGDDGMSLRNH